MNKENKQTFYCKPEIVSINQGKQISVLKVVYYIY